MMKTTPFTVRLLKDAKKEYVNSASVNTRAKKFAWSAKRPMTIAMVRKKQALSKVKMD
jgi:hypothetical protein